MPTEEHAGQRAISSHVAGHGGDRQRTPPTGWLTSCPGAQATAVQIAERFDSDVVDIGEPEASLHLDLNRALDHGEHLRAGP